MFVLSACNSPKLFLKSHSDLNNKRKKVYDEHLLVKNSILINKAKLNSKKNNPIVCADSVLIYPQNYFLESDLSSNLYYDMYAMLRQKPNRTFLLSRPNLYIYNLSDTMKVKYRYDKKFSWERAAGDWVKGGIKADTITKIRNKYKPQKFRKFLMKKIGEPPVIFDATKAEQTARSMQNYLIQKGFLDAKVGYKVNLKNYRAYVTYHYSTEKPIIIDSVVFQSEDPTIASIMNELAPESDLKKGEPMDKTDFQLEKTRLTSEIRNRGFYNFNWNYINFFADTTNASKVDVVEYKGLFGKQKSKLMGEQGEKRVQIYVSVNSPSDTVKSHTQYSIKNVYIVLDEPKIELHKYSRKYEMDSSFITLRPPRKKVEISHLYKSNFQQYGKKISLNIYANGDMDIFSEIKNELGRDVLLISGAKHPYWFSMKKIKNGSASFAQGSMEQKTLNSLQLNFETDKNKAFVKSSVNYKFKVINPVDSVKYLVELSPYKRRFIRNSYKTFSEIDPEDIPIQIVLRKSAKSLETDSLKKIKDLTKKKKENFIIKDNVISRFVEIKSGSLYTYNAGSETVKNLSELEIFRFPRVEYIPSKLGTKNELDAYVYMQKAKKKSFGVDLDLNSMTNSSSAGLALNVNFKNRNIFKGAEIFLFNIEGGVNGSRSRARANSGKVEGLIGWIDLLDVNSSVNLVYPKIIGFRNWTLSVEKPKTRVSLAYHYLQQSIDFRVSSFDAQYGYDWQRKNGTHKFSFNPFMLNFTLEPILDPGFEVRLKESNFALWASLKEQFFLPGINFTYTFTPKLNRKHSLQIREFIETTGNSAFIYNLITQKDLELFKTTISQYYKSEFEIRYTYKAAKKHILATRLIAGAAVPVYKTSRVPYSRQFFLGGPSSMRGWAMRQLGPGRIRSEDGAQFQLGDIRLEMNLEYRFMFNTWIGSTLFADVGNIWYAKNYNIFTPQIPYSNIEDGVFNADFINELAMDIGTGLRLDFSFFVIRFDLAVPIRNPAGFSRKDQNGFVNYTDDKGFPIYWKFDWRNTNFVLAVGYPF
jgi:hypothetical protein